MIILPADVNLIINAIVTGMTGNALYDGLKALFVAFWPRLINLKDDKKRLLDELTCVLESKNDDIVFVTTLKHLLHKHRSVANIITGDNSAIVKNTTINGNLVINNEISHGKAKERFIDNDLPMQIVLDPHAFYQEIWDKVF